MKEMDDHAWEVLCLLAATCDVNVHVIMEGLKDIGEIKTMQLQKIRDDISASVKAIPRPPAEIKKDIKHEKNPMRLKQLNKELNESYKHLRISDIWNKTTTRYDYLKR